jgi:hypothetical protein
MALFQKKRKIPTNASEVMEFVYSNHPDFAFNMVFVAPMTAKALRSDKPGWTAVDPLMSDENPVYNLLTMPGMMLCSRVIGECFGLASELGITADQFDSYMDDPGYQRFDKSC